jgi:hypothetical protein
MDTDELLAAKERKKRKESPSLLCTLCALLRRSTRILQKPRYPSRPTPILHGDRQIIVMARDVPIWLVRKLGARVSRPLFAASRGEPAGPRRTTGIHPPGVRPDGGMPTAKTPSAAPETDALPFEITVRRA